MNLSSNLIMSGNHMQVISIKGILIFWCKKISLIYFSGSRINSAWNDSDDPNMRV